VAWNEKMEARDWVKRRKAIRFAKLYKKEHVAHYKWRKKNHDAERLF